MDQNGNTVEIRTNAVKQSNGGYAIDIYDTDWTASKLADVLAQLPNKADTSTVYAQIADVKDTAKSNLDKAKSDLNDAINANVTQLQNSKLNFKYITNGYDLLSADGFWGVMEASNAQNLKNLPNGMNNKSWMYVLKLVKDGFGTVIIFDQDNRIWVNNKNGDVWNGWASYAHQSDVTALQNIINQQNQTIQSLTSRLNNAENEINYIKANYVEGRTFPASQEAQANSWENENPQRIAFITK